MTEEVTVLAATTHALAQRSDAYRSPEDGYQDGVYEDVSVALAGGSPLLQSGILTSLRPERRITVRTCSVDVDDAAAKARQLGCDVFILYADEPLSAANRAAERLREGSRPTRVIVLTQSQNSFEMLATLRTGVLGYGILGSLRPEDVCAGVIAVARGGSWLCPVATRQLVDIALQQPAPVTALPLPKGSDVDLSERELQVLRLLALDKGEQEISEALAISRNTVKTYIRRICEKFDVGSRSEAIRFAIQHGIIPDRRTRIALTFAAAPSARPAYS